MTILELALLPISIFILIAVNAFFVAAEMALARVLRVRIEQLAKDGNNVAERAKAALNNPENYISACQLGITLSTLALGVVGEKAFADVLMQVFVDAGWHGPIPVMSAARASCYIIAFSLTAFLQIIFGELLPKTLTYRRAESVFLAFIVPMDAWQWVMSPFLNLLNGVTMIILRLLRVSETPRHRAAFTEEELRMLVSASQREGVLEEEEQEMIHSVFDFSATQVHEIMTPRTDMACIAGESTIRQFIDMSLTRGLSRIPLFDRDIDNIFGTVHIRDGLKALVENKENNPVRELSRKVLFVPENKNVVDLLAEFKRTKTHMAIVVDEYGGTRGLVTIEDLIEELVGDITDEYDVVQENVVVQEDGSFVVNAKISLDDANEQLGLKIEDDRFNTLGGHVFGLLGREPRIGDQVTESNCVLRVEEADHRRIIRLRVIKHNSPADVVDPNSHSIDNVHHTGTEDSSGEKRRKPQESKK